MNRIYRSIWNCALGAWVAAPETARRGGVGSAGAPVVGSGATCYSAAAQPLWRLRGAAAAVALAWGGMPVAWAACDPFTANGTSNCSGVITTGITTSVNNLTVNVLAGAQVSPGLGQTTAVNLNGNNVRFNNAGTVDPSLLGLVSQLTSGVTIGNANPSVVNITNSGTLRGTGGMLAANLSAVTGMALTVRNGASGTTNITNSGTIGSNALLGLTLFASDTPVVTVYGGSKVNFTNEVGANITGRIAFQANATGNTFTNAGTITGGVSMGAGGGNNTFNAITGSVVQKGTGTAGNLGIVGLTGVIFAATGIIDGGAGGSNILNLQNGVDNSANGSGSVSSANYQNFSNLVVSGGTWTVLGPLLTGTTSVQLNGGTVSFNDAGAFGTGGILANGGSLASLNPSISLSNLITLGTNGLSVSGSNALTIASQITGSGALTKTGTSTLFLSNATNNFTGGVTLAGGALSLANAGSLSSGTLSVTGASSLQTSAAMTLANTINLGATLGLANTSALTLSGNLTGAGALSKTGNGDVTLSGTNNFSGGVNLAAGKLILGSVGAIGSGTLSVSGASALDTTSAQTLSNSANLSSGALTLTGSNNLTLGGVIGGAGSLVKAGTNTLTLSGANNFSGGVTLQGGTLAVGSNTALGTGSLTANVADATLDSTAAVALNNNIALGARTLTLTGNNATALSGAISGTTGGLVKQGAADLTLSGGNTFTGGVQLQAGKLILGSNNALGGASSVLTAAAGTTLDSVGVRTLNNTVNLAGNVTVAGSSDLTLSGIISGVAGALTKNGTGTLTLGGINTFQGGLALNSGTLLVGNHGALGSGALTTAAGTTLGATGTGITLNNLVNLNGDLTLNGPNNLSLSGVVSGTGNLVKNGNQIVQLAAANTFVGNTILNAGTLYLGNAGALGQGRLIANAGSIDALSAVAIANGITLNGAMTVGGLSNMTLQGVIEGSGSLVKDGVANLTLSGVNTYSGGTSLNGGTLTLGNAGAIGAGDLTVGGGASLATTSAMTLNNALHLNAGLTQAGNDDLTLDGTIDGLGGLTKNGTGVLKLNGVNTYAGGTSLNGGTLVVGGTSALGSGTLSTSNGTALDSNGVVTLANNLNVTGNLLLLGSSDLTLDGVVGGTGSLTKNGTGTLALNGVNTYGGGTVLNGGGLALGNSDAISNGALLVGGAASLSSTAAIVLANDITLDADLTVTGGSDLTLDGVIDGSAGLVKQGTGTLSLNGINLYAGATTINAGTLALGARGSLASSGAVSLGGSGAAFDISAAGVGQTIGALSGVAGSQIQLGSQTLSFGDGSNQMLAAAIHGTGGIVKQGAGTQTLTGANDFTGGTTINEGTLALGYGGSLASTGGVNLANAGTIFDISNASTNQTIGALSGVAGSQVELGSQTLSFGDGSNQTLAAAIHGTGGIVKQGAGTQTLTGANDFTGGTQINAGTLALSGAGSLAATGALHLASGGTFDISATNSGSTIGALSGAAGSSVALGGKTLTLGDASNTSFAGTITGTGGALVKQGAGTQVLAGNVSYAGNTDVNAGALHLTGLATLGGDVNVANGAALAIASTDPVSVGGSVNLTDGSVLSIQSQSTSPDLRADSVRIGQNVGFNLSGIHAPFVQNRTLISTTQGINGDFATVSIGGFQGLVDYLTLNTGKSGDGKSYLASYGLSWTAQNPLAQGSFTLANATDKFEVGVALTDQNPNSALNWDGKALTKKGDGTLILSGANSYTGGTTIHGGTLQVGNGGTSGTLGAGDVRNDGTLSLDRSDAVTIANAIDGTGRLIQQGAGTVILTGNNSYSGGTTIVSGGLQVGEGGTTGSLGTGAVTNNGVLSVDRSDAFTLAQRISGTGALQQQGSGTTTLTGANSYTGGTTIAGGAVNVGGGGANGTLGGGDVDIASGAVLIFGRSDTLMVSNNITGAGHVNQNGNGVTGTTILTGNNTYSGTTTVNTGTLQVGDGGTTGTLGGGAVVNNGTLVFKRSDSLNVAHSISGSGSVTQSGSGTTMLMGSNSYSGGTAIDAGTLAVNGLVAGNVSVSAAGTLGGSGSIGGNVNVLGTLAPGNSLGTLTIKGNLTLDPASTTVFQLGQAGAAGSSSNDLVHVGGTLSLGGSLQATASAAGWYRLFNYGSTLQSSTFGSMNISSSLPGFMVASSSLHTGNGQVNLELLGAGQTTQFWNGSNTAATSGVQGGSGTWANFGTNWTDSNGQSSSGWGGSIGIFGDTAGTVTVDGPVRFDTLQFDTDGYSVVAGSGGKLELSPSTVAQGGVINTNGVDVSTTISAPIVDGTANKLVKVGAGTLTLAGINTYTGGTTVTGGTLSVASDDNLGASSGALRLNGGTLQIAGTDFTSNNGRSWEMGQVGAGIDIADATHVFTLDSRLAGSGGLYKTGSGTLKLSGANTYTGGTTIGGGTLALGAGGSLATTGTVALAGNGATFDISGASAAQTIAVLQGVAGSRVLLGSNALTFGDATSTSFDGAFSGSGALTKQGTGSLTLTGGSSAFAGSTTINAGTLAVAANARLGGALTVASGATLTGTGTVGALGTPGNANTLTRVQSGATVAPGDAANPYGTLRVAGDLEFEAGSTYRVQVDPASNASSRIDVGGSATLAGGVLHVGNEANSSNDFQVGKTYTILSAASLKGQFDTVASNYAYLDPTLSYVASDVQLQLQRKALGGGTGGGNTGGGNGSGQMAFADLADTRNQAGVANGIESLGSGALYNHVLHLPNGAPAAFFSQVSGDTHASVSGSLPGLGAFAPNLSGQHLRANLTAGLNPGAPVAQSDGPLPASAWPSSKALPAWAEVVGHWQTFDGDGNAAQLKQRTTGLFLGMDQEVGTSGWRLGGSVGYTNADGKVADRASESYVNSYSAAVYGGKSFGTGTGPRINVLGGLAYTWHDIETTRRVTSLGQTLKADYSAHTAQLFAEVGYAIGQYDAVGVEPFLGVNVGTQRTRGFQEHGGFAALQGRSSSDDLASTTLGVRLHSDFTLAGKEGRLRATAGWRHALGDVAQSKTMAFEGGQNFTVAGAPLARNTALLGLEADVALSRSAALVLGYRGELASGQRDHSANVKLRWAF